MGELRNKRITLQLTDEEYFAVASYARKRKIPVATLSHDLLLEWFGFGMQPTAVQPRLNDVMVG